jgi:AcrR family transcriptional regulator
MSGLRVDAERNRQRILTAAREVFAEQGIEAPMEDVARRAGVGVGTLYRRYPTRADLVAAAFEAKMAAYADVARQALADPDPWHAFCVYVERICAMQAGDRGFTTVLTMTFPTAKRFEADRDAAFARLAAWTGVTPMIPPRTRSTQHVEPLPPRIPPAIRAALRLRRLSP